MKKPKTDVMPDQINFDRESRTYTMGWADAMARRILAANKAGVLSLVIGMSDAVILLAALKSYRERVADRDDHDVFLMRANWSNAAYKVEVTAQDDSI